MSIGSEIQPTILLTQPNRHYLWLAAAIAPLLIAPLWLALPPLLPGQLRSLSGLTLFLLLAVATATDLSQRKIFNWTTYTAFSWAVVINLGPHASWTGAIGLSQSLSGAASCLAIMLIPYTLARGGAGDVKLAAAIGALVGVDSGLLVIAFTYIVAGLMIAGWTVWNQGPFNLLAAIFRRVGSRWFPQSVMPPTRQHTLLLDQPIPLAGFFAIATLLVVFDIPTLLGSG